MEGHAMPDRFFDILNANSRVGVTATIADGKPRRCMEAFVERFARRQLGAFRSKPVQASQGGTRLKKSERVNLAYRGDPSKSD